MNDLNRLPDWAFLAIASILLLLSPALAFLLAIVAEIVIGWLFEGGVPALIALAAACAIGWLLLRRRRGRTRENAPDCA